MRRAERSIALMAVVALAGFLGGCTDHFANRDTVSSHAGDAIAWNKAVHVIDPWPAYRSSIGRTNGARLEETMGRYRAGLAPANAKPNGASASPSIPIVPGLAPAPTN